MQWKEKLPRGAWWSFRAVANFLKYVGLLLTVLTAPEDWKQKVMGTMLTQGVPWVVLLIATGVFFAIAQAGRIALRDTQSRPQLAVAVEQRAPPAAGDAVVDQWFAARNERSQEVTKDPTQGLVLARPEGNTNPMPVWRNDGGVALHLHKDPPFVVLGWPVVNASPYVLSTDDTISGHILMGGAPLSRPCVTRRALRNVGYLDKGAFVVHQHFTDDEVTWLKERWNRSVIFDPTQLVVRVHSDVHGESFRWRLRPLSVTPSGLGT